MGTLVSGTKIVLQMMEIILEDLFAYSIVVYGTKGKKALRILFDFFGRYRLLVNPV